MAETKHVYLSDEESYYLKQNNIQIKDLVKSAINQHKNNNLLTKSEETQRIERMEKAIEVLQARLLEMQVIE